MSWPDQAGMAAPAGLDWAVAEAVGDAERLFEEIGRQTTVDGAIRRPPYDAGEQIALDAVAEAGRAIGLSVATDLAGNLQMTWPAEGREKRCLVGSHLDSVPRGGNFDGLAGVLGALAAVTALRRAGFRPGRSLTILGLRGEENAWFACQHIGSRIALGLFDPSFLDGARRADTGRTLADHMTAAGIDLGPIRAGRRSIEPGSVRCYLELHIEQGPVLEECGLAVGIATGLRGTVRCRSARLIGQYGHAGTVPRALRRDAVLGLAALISRMEAVWKEQEAAGADLVLTFGEIGTDASSHSITVVPGEARFTFEARSNSTAILASLEATLRSTAAAVSAERGLAIDFAPFSHSLPQSFDCRLQGVLRDAAASAGLPVISLASGAGHDAGDFAEAGVPTAMLFVRNANGSHNPAEAMSMADFAAGVRILARALAHEAGARPD